MRNKCYLLSCGVRGVNDLSPMEDVLDYIEKYLRESSFPVDEDGLSIDCVSTDFTMWILDKILHDEALEEIK